MVVKVGINGFGHNGCSIVPTPLKDSNIQVDSINDPFKGLDYSVNKYTHSQTKCSASSHGNQLLMDGQTTAVFQEALQTAIPWDKHLVDPSKTTDTTIHNDTIDTCLEIGAKDSVISAPSTDMPLLTIHVRLDGYMTSTTGGTKMENDDGTFASVVKELVTTRHDIMTTQTTEEDLCDKDRRILCNSASNAMPMFNRLTKAQPMVMSKFDEKVTGVLFRVLDLGVSVAELINWLEQPTSYDEIKAAIKKLSDDYLHSIIGYSEDDMGPTDFAGGSRSRILDRRSGISWNSPGAKLEPWYNYDFGCYSSRTMNCVPQTA